MSRTKKTEDVPRRATFLKCAPISVAIRKKSVPKVMIAFDVIIELKISTTLRSTSRSSAQLTQTKLTNVSMGKSVLLHIMKMNCPWTFLKKWIETQTSTCFTLKLCGVLLVTRTISETSVSTPITGKTTDAVPIRLSILTHNAQVGKLRKTRKHIRTAANWNTVAAPATVGKNLNTIQTVTKPLSAEFLKEENAVKLTVLIITTNKRKDSKWRMVSSRCSQEIEERFKVRYANIKNTLCRHYSKMSRGLRL